MMPVERLPAPSWQTTFGLGFVSAVFDNIPLTALALEQGGYDWGMLAYAVGFGGSMIWFGSSAGVAVTNVFPEARSVGAWVRHGWHVPLAYIVGFFVLLATWAGSRTHRIARRDGGCGSRCERRSRAARPSTLARAARRRRAACTRSNQSGRSGSRHRKLPGLKRLPL